MMPMMGGGLTLMLLFLCLVIAVPLLIIALVAGGGLTALFGPRNQTGRRGDEPPPMPQRGHVRKCTTCGQGVKTDWNVCPSCGAPLT